MPAVVKGRCVSETGAGVAFLPVTVDSLPTFTDFQGNFRIEVMPREETYELNIRSPIHRAVSQKIMICEEREYDMGNIQMVNALVWKF